MAATMALLVATAAVAFAAGIVAWNPAAAETLLFTQTLVVRVILLVVAIGLLATQHYGAAAGILFVATLWFLVNRPDEEVL